VEQPWCVERRRRKRSKKKKMVSLVVASNLTEILAVIVATGLAFCIFAIVWILKIVTIRNSKPKHVRHNPIFKSHEDGWLFWLAWAGSCVVTAILISYYFTHYFQVPDIIETASDVLAFIWLYMFAMMFWVLFQYVWVRSTNTVQYIFIVLAILFAAADTIMILIKSQNPQDFFFVILQFIPPALAVFATRDSSIFRTSLESTIFAAGPALDLGDNSNGNGGRRGKLHFGKSTTFTATGETPVFQER
jgi:amino acid transporter